MGALMDSFCRAKVNPFNPPYRLKCVYCGRDFPDRRTFELRRIRNIMCKRNPMLSREDYIPCPYCGHGKIMMMNDYHIGFKRFYK